MGFISSFLNALSSDSGNKPSATSSSAETYLFKHPFTLYVYDPSPFKGLKRGETVSLEIRDARSDMRFMKRCGWTGGSDDSVLLLSGGVPVGFTNVSKSDSDILFSLVRKCSVYTKAKKVGMYDSQIPDLEFVLDPAAAAETVADVKIADVKEDVTTEFTCGFNFAGSKVRKRITEMVDGSVEMEDIDVVVKGKKDTGKVLADAARLASLAQGLSEDIPQKAMSYINMLSDPPSDKGVEILAKIAPPTKTGKPRKFPVKMRLYINDETLSPLVSCLMHYTPEGRCGKADIYAFYAREKSVKVKFVTPKGSSEIEPELIELNG